MILPPPTLGDALAAAGLPRDAGAAHQDGQIIMQENAPLPHPGDPVHKRQPAEQVG